MELDVIKKKEHLRNFIMLFTHPITLLKEVNFKSSTHTFFGIFVAVGLLRAVFATAMPFELFERVFMKENIDLQFIEGVNAFSMDSIMSMFSEPYYRLPFYLADFFMGDGLILLTSITFYWIALWALTKGRKYPVEFGEVVNIFFITYTPMLLYMLGAIMFQYFTGVVTLLPYDSLGYLIWTLANPFVLYQVVFMAFGIEKTLGLNKMISWGLVLLYYGGWIMLNR